jgi:hypothetical protein
MTPPDFQERSNEFDEIVETGRQQNGKGDKGKSDGGGSAGASPTVLPPPANPMQVAREFVARHCLHEDGTTVVLRYWRDGWWAWRGSHWRETERRYVMSLLYHFTEHALFWSEKDEEFKPWAPTHRKIADLLDSTLSMVYARMGARARLIPILGRNGPVPSWGPSPKDPPNTWVGRGQEMVLSLRSLVSMRLRAREPKSCSIKDPMRRRTAGLD